MKRLFYVRRGDGKKVSEAGSVLYFETKEAAKVVRNELNEKHGGHTIALGPDHMGKHGVRNPKRKERRGW